MEALFETVKKLGQKEGVDFELSVGQAESFSAGFQSRKLHKYKVDNSQGAGIRVLKERGSGFARTENLSEEAIRATFYEALQSAIESNKFAKANKEPEQIYFTEQQVEVPGLKGQLTLSVEDKLQIAKDLEEKALQEDPRITHVPYSGYSENVSTTYLFNSKGLHRQSESTVVTAYTYLLAREGEDSKMGYEAQFSRSNAEIDPADLAKRSAKAALELLGARGLPSGKYAVLFDRDVFSDLVSFLTAHLSADRIDENTSLLSGKLGQKVLNEKINILDDPFDVSLMGARAYDAEGVPSQTTALVEKGVITNILTNSFLARKLRLPLTGHAVRTGAQLGVAPSNVVMRPGTSDFNDLLSSANTVFYVTQLDALHSGFKPSTLDFSLPARGLLYENGKLAGPIHQVVLSGNLLEILSGPLELSNRRSLPAGNILTPDVLVPQMSVAGA